MSAYVYEVHVSAQHWAEGCDYHGMGVENTSQCCPVYRAMVEAGLPVGAVCHGGWYTQGVLHLFPSPVVDAITRFDDVRLGLSLRSLPEPLTFYVDL